MNTTPYGFRVVGHRAGTRRLIDHAAAFRAHAECDPRAEPDREADAHVGADAGSHITVVVIQDHPTTIAGEDDLLQRPQLIAQIVQIRSDVLGNAL